MNERFKQYEKKVVGGKVTSSSFTGNKYGSLDKYH